MKNWLCPYAVCALVPLPAKQGKSCHTLKVPRQLLAGLGHSMASNSPGTVPGSAEIPSRCDLSPLVRNSTSLAEFPAHYDNVYFKKLGHVNSNWQALALSV